MMTKTRYLTVALLVLATACGDDGTGPGSDADTGQETLRAETLAALANNVIVPALEAAAGDLAALETALAAYAAAPTATLRDEARAAWQTASMSWQQVEMMQVGPAAAMDLAAGGQDLRDQVYPWPALSRCAVDQDSVGDQRSDIAAIRDGEIDRRGLGAIEYVLFDDSGENSCSPLNPLNADGTWDAVEDLEQRRATHAHSMAQVALENAEAALAAWQPTNGNFVQELTDPSRSGALFGSSQEGLNAVSDAMFYLDKETKDMKVGEPAGITDAANADARESRHANVSRDMIVANLRGFQRLYHGGAPGGSELGFDDLLVAMNAGDFAALMGEHISIAITAVEAIEPTLLESLTANPDAVRAAFDAIQQVTEDLKTMFVSVLDLEIPNRAAGDTD